MSGFACAHCRDTGYEDDAVAARAGRPVAARCLQCSAWERTEANEWPDGLKPLRMRDDEDFIASGPGLIEEGMKRMAKRESLSFVADMCDAAAANPRLTKLCTILMVQTLRRFLRKTGVVVPAFLSENEALGAAASVLLNLPDRDDDDDADAPEPTPTKSVPV